MQRLRSRILIVLLVLAALLFYSANLRRGQQATSAFERVVLRVTAPAQAGLDAVCRRAAQTWGRYLWLVDTARENERLREENRWLQAELRQVDEIRLANKRLRRLLAFQQKMEKPALPARVIAEDASSWFRTVVIDKGREDGILPDMPVVVAEGVVGRVIRSASGEARVLLVTDASSAVASLVQRDRARGVSRGQGSFLSLEFALRQKDIRAGDRIVTSGTGGVFPKGLTLGRVRDVTKERYGLFQNVEVVPAVDFARLEEVLVLIGERP